MLPTICRREDERAERMRRALEYEEPEWVREADAGSDKSEGAALIEDELYCIACDKFFKSEKALANHKRQVTSLTSVNSHARMRTTERPPVDCSRACCYICLSRYHLT